MARIPARGTLFVFAPLVVVATAANVAMKGIQKYREMRRKAPGRVTGFVGEMYGAAQAVKLATAEAHVLERFRTLNARRGEAAIKDRMFNELLYSVFRNTFNLGIGGILILAGRAMAAGPGGTPAFTVGNLNLFVFYLSWVSEFTGMFGMAWARYKQVGVSLARQTKLLRGETQGLSPEIAEQMLVEHGPVYVRGDVAEIPYVHKMDAHRLETLKVDGLTFKYPAADNGTSRGIEDVRLVRFTDDDGRRILFGTYTAYNGFAIFPTLLESEDLNTLEIHTMAGRYAKNKGMALFPRRIRGKYVMSGRLDGENLFILESDNVRVWNDGRLVQTPKYWWEFSVIGNCGSPLETEDGWLLLTHGVGPMRQYCIGAVLLDLDEPWKIIGRTREPLVMPTGEERIGYVPNVVYTCGAMIHNDQLVIPYAASDTVTTFACVSLPDLLTLLKRSRDDV